MILVILFFQIFLLQNAAGHVVLTFPPARKYQFDFLEVSRTKQPCGGIPKSAIGTTLISGSTINVKWRRATPQHKGSIGIQLLDPNGFMVSHLKKYDHSIRIQGQTVEVEIPIGLACVNCTLKLITYDDYFAREFLSCADVDIVDEKDYVISCSGKGIPSSDGTSCLCDDLYKGKHCEVYSECETQYQCGGNNRGLCYTSTYVGGNDNKGGDAVRHCYCQIGYFGDHCQHESELNSKVWNISLYHHVPLERNFDFYWTEIELGVLEGIIVATTDNFVAIGWRPQDINGECRQVFPPGLLHSQYLDHFNSMDCTDMVIGSAKSSYSRVRDYYTRDRSTPMIDEEYDGTQGILASAGWEEDGVTTIMFRKLMKANHPSDHDFKGNLHLIWAFGSSFGARKDLLTYHNGRNRGRRNIVGPTVAGSESSFLDVRLHVAAMFLLTCFGLSSPTA